MPLTAGPESRIAAADLLEPVPFSDIAGWRDDDFIAAFGAFRTGAVRAVHHPPTTRAFSIDGADLQRIAGEAARCAGTLDKAAARQFFERHFRPYRIAAAGFVTAYYEPEVAASLTRRSGFEIPLYRRPRDLTEVSPEERPPEWDPEMRFARRGRHGLEPFFDRAEIEAGALDGQGLELAWLADPVDAFFIHVQGSARLRLVDGGTLRIGFDGKSGHPYTSIGRLAVERGLLGREEADRDGLAAWLRADPARARSLMQENRSFIFFRPTELSEGEGPIGAAGVPLTRGRSLAVDRMLMTFHTPVWVDAPGLSDPDRPGEPFRRLMVAQDTGSAIVGPARGDLFYGSGEAAGSTAGRVRHEAAMIVLVPAGPDLT